jgi:hypothetical protein
LTGPDSSREDQARRDLARIEREREKLFHDHPGAANDDNDPIEVLGKRIAHHLSLRDIYSLKTGAWNGEAGRGGDTHDRLQDCVVSGWFAGDGGSRNPQRGKHL